MKTVEKGASIADPWEGGWRSWNEVGHADFLEIQSNDVHSFFQAVNCSKWSPGKLKGSFGASLGGSLAFPGGAAETEKA